MLIHDYDSLPLTSSSVVTVINLAVTSHSTQVKLQQLEYDYSPMDSTENENTIYKSLYAHSEDDETEDHAPRTNTRTNKHTHPRFLDRFGTLDEPSTSPPPPQPQPPLSPQPLLSPQPPLSSDSEENIDESESVYEESESVYEESESVYEESESVYDESETLDSYGILGAMDRTLLSEDYVEIDDLNEDGTVMRREEEEVPSTGSKRTSLRKKKRKRSKKGKGRLRGKGDKKPVKPVPVFIHNGMTENEKDYEICFRAEGVVLPTSGYYGVTAATGGLADDHDVLKFLVNSLRSSEEMAQMRMNEEEEARFQKEFEVYQQKTQKARDDYLALNPDAVRKDQQEYETSEARELRQIFQGQGQIFDVIKHLSVKLDEVVGKQDRTLSLVSGGQINIQPGQGQLPAPEMGGSDLNRLLVSQNEVVNAIRDIKQMVSDVQVKSQQILNKPHMGQGSVQPVGGGGYDFHITLKELNEGLNIIKRDLSLANQKLGVASPSGAGAGAQVGGCPQVTCVSTAVFVVFMVCQVALLLGYFVYRDSKEAKAKKFY